MFIPLRPVTDMQKRHEIGQTRSFGSLSWLIVSFMRLVQPIKNKALQFAPLTFANFCVRATK